jgi:hypothetical protein
MGGQKYNAYGISSCVPSAAQQQFSLTTGLAERRWLRVCRLVCRPTRMLQQVDRTTVGPHAYHRDPSPNNDVSVI